MRWNSEWYIRFYSNKTLGIAGSIRLKTNGEIHGRDIHGHSVNAKNGGLNSSSNLYVRRNSKIGGDLKVNGNVGIRRNPHPKVGLIVNGRGRVNAIETVGEGIECDKRLRVSGTSQFNGNVGVKIAPHPKISLRVNRNKYKFIVDGDLYVSGDTETQNLLSYGYIELTTK